MGPPRRAPATARRAAAAGRWARSGPRPAPSGTAGRRPGHRQGWAKAAPGGARAALLPPPHDPGEEHVLKRAHSFSCYVLLGAGWAGPAWNTNASRVTRFGRFPPLYLLSLVPLTSSHFCHSCPWGGAGYTLQNCSSYPNSPEIFFTFMSLFWRTSCGAEFSGCFFQRDFEIFVNTSYLLP